MSEQEPDQTALTKSEMDIVRKIAERDGCSVDEAATRLTKAALARRVKRRTGKSPAKVHDIKKKF